MLDSIYQTGWGALGIVLFMFIPFFIVFLTMIRKRANVNPASNSQEPRQYRRAEVMWLGFVTTVFVAVNLVSISYMPTVTTAKAKAAAEVSGVAITDVEVVGQSWYFDISKTELEVGKPVRFLGKSKDTIHGFAVYHPNGKVLFTMMLMPGLDNPTSLIHTFKEPGTYTVRCLEYCGLQHHGMKDEIVVVDRKI